jgi:hypothetical protein
LCWQHTRADSLAGENVDAQPPLIEVLDVEGATGQCRHELDLGLVEEVVLLAREAGVGLLLDLEDDIACLDARCLVTLAAELDLGTTPDTLVDVDVENLPVDNSLLAIALLATVLGVDNLALAAAVGADGLEALDHGTHLAHHGLHAMSVASGAALNCSVLAATTFTLSADDGALQSQLGDLATVDVLQGDLVGVVDGAGLGGAAALAAAAAEHAAEAAAASEELGEQVLGSHATAAAGTALKASLAILIVDGALLGVGQNLVCVGDLLELVFGGRVVRVLVFCAVRD